MKTLFILGDVWRYLAKFNDVLLLHPGTHYLLDYQHY